MLPTYSKTFAAVFDPGFYEVCIYENVLGSRKTIYEIYKPGSALPWSFVMPTVTSRIQIFHNLVGSDDFDRDNYFIGQLWVWIHKTPFRRGDLDINIESEPHVYRRNADDLIYNMEQARLMKSMLEDLDEMCAEAFVSR